MRVTNGTYIIEVQGTTLIDTSTGAGILFTASVVEGIDNFTGQYVYKAIVRGEGSTRGGSFYTMFDEAADEARRLLATACEECERDAAELGY